MQEELTHIIESLLFVSEDPLTVQKLKNILETVDAKEIRASLESLAEAYESRGGGFKLAQVAGGWQLRSRPEYNEWIKRMLQPPPQRLSKAALETLAIVAYNQPIIRADIEHIRGVDCGGVLRQLLERKLVRVLGRKEIPGRPLIYATTKLFLELFELKDLKDLPSPKEIEEMGIAADEPQNNPPPELENQALIEISPSQPSAPGQTLPKMRFSMPLDSAPPEAADHPSKTAEVNGPSTGYKVFDSENGLSPRRSELPAGEADVSFTRHRISNAMAGKLPNSKGKKIP